MMANDSICEHYHVTARHVGKLELVKAAWWFYQEFSAQVLRLGTPGSGPVARRPARRHGATLAPSRGPALP
ncbi:MAG: hypothetical protein MZW92_58775 [Comamonadaceae bacterium]|nr:hypothetical protein [Comamonadaceae bacterium]